MFVRLALVAGLGFLLPTLAQAAPLTAQDVFSQFNLVVLQNITSRSEVEGRTYVGGNASGGNYAIHNGQMPASSYAGITTGGSLSGNVNVNGGGIAVGGNVSGNVNVNNGGGVVMGNANANFNGSTPSYVGGSRSGNANSGKVSSPASNATLSGYSDGLSSANATNIATVLGDESKAIAGLAANSTATLTGNTLNFNATPVNGVAVFDINSFDGISQFNFDLGSATTIFINSSVEDDALNINFLGGAAAKIGAKVIWNFYDATSLIFNSQWGGSVLAPDAAVTLNQNLEGTLVAMSLTQNAEIHMQQFTGTLPPSLQPVPVPASYISFASGLAVLFGLWMMSRRRSSSPASGMSHAAA